MSTGAWLRCTKTTSALRNFATYTLYDEKSRPIRIFNRNHENSPGGYNQIDSKFDFIGKVEYTSSQHKRINSDPIITVKDIFTYTKNDLPAIHTQQINGGTPQLISENNYDNLNKLTWKKVGNNVAFPLQKIDYQYNIRGWLIGINNDPTNSAVLNTADNDLFAFKINYNTVETSANGFTGQQLFNGNISETYWRSINGNNLRKYSYLYDDLSRLRDAVYERPDTPGNINSYNESLTYDMNGNISTVMRNGDSDNAFPIIGIDNLVYLYDLNGSNRLMKVTDTTNNTSGFKDDSNGFNDTLDDYTYDVNGNMTRDDNKGITEINYNHLNLPVLIKFGANGNIEYLYDASGQKIEKIVTIGSTLTTTKYLGGFQYVNNVLKIFPHSEGYINKNGSAYTYVFNYKDHLGNIRLSYQDGNQDGQIATSEILEENHYYPFGLKHSGYNTSNAQPFYKYKYNGKENQDELGLNLYDYGARNYDASIGRWINIDPMTEKYFSATPYNYVLNSPVNSIDPDGMDRYLINDAGETILALKEDKADMLFAVGNQKIKNATISNITDTNNDGKQNDKDGLKVQSKGLIGQLTSKRAGSEKNIEGGYFSSIGEQSAQHERDYQNLFKYISDNTKAEFSLTFFRDRGKDFIQLSTFQDSGETPSPYDLGIKDPNKNVSRHYHSHPEIRPNKASEVFSIQGNTGDSDYGHSYYQNRTYPNYIYFPNSSKLYNVTPSTINYIKSINNGADLKN